MDFKDRFLKALRDDTQSIYDSFLQISTDLLPRDTDERYRYLRSDVGKFIARDEADVDVYVHRVARRHHPKFKWLYRNLFESQKEIFSKDLDVVIWGCGCGLDLLAFYDCAIAEENPQLWTTVRHITLIDISDAALKRAETVAKILFPIASIAVIKCDLSNVGEIDRNVSLRRLIGFVPRIHLISNLLDLFDDATDFAKAMRTRTGRLYNDGHTYFNEFIVAFSPEYRAGRVAQNIRQFRDVWRNGDYCGEEIVNLNGPDNCEFSLFAYRTLRNDRCYKSFMSGKNYVLNKLVAECPEVISGFDILGFVRTLSKIKVLGSNFYRMYRWVEVYKYKGNVERIILVAAPNKEFNPKPCVVEFSEKGDVVSKGAERALGCLKRKMVNGANSLGGRKEDFAILVWDGSNLKSDGDCSLDSDEFWKYDGEVDYSLCFRIDSGDTEPLPDIQKMDEKQKEIIYSRKQYRKIRGGAGCGKTTTMLWHAVMSILRTHLPVLIVCKTVTLFNRNSKRMAATLLREIPELTYVDSDLIKFMTLDSVLCKHAQMRNWCFWMKCAKCSGCEEHNIPDVNCADFNKYEGDRYGRKLKDSEKQRCCDVCMKKSVTDLSRKGTNASKNAGVYGAVLIDEVQSADPAHVQAVVNLTYGGNPARECYVFCDERQSLRQDAVEVDVEKQKLRVKVPDRGDGYGRWIDLNTPYRTSCDFSGRLLDVAIRLQSLTVPKYGSVELSRSEVDYQMELTGTVFSIRRSVNFLLQDVLIEILDLTSNGENTITVICDNPENVRELLVREETKNWISTHAIGAGHKKVQQLRETFREVEGRIHLTTVTLAQGWDFKNVIFVCTTENDGKKNTMENVLTGATRATNFMRILDRTASGWLYDVLKDLSQGCEF